MSYEKKELKLPIFEKIMITTFELMNYLQAQNISSVGWVTSGFHREFSHPLTACKNLP